MLGRQAGRANNSRSRTRQGHDYLHIAVDDFSRAAYVEVHDNERGDTASGFLKRAADWLARHGVTVAQVLTDNGACYRSGAFRTVVTDLGAVHKCTRPTGRRPTAKPNASTPPSTSSGPTPGLTPATRPAWTTCPAGCTTTTTTDAILHSRKGPHGPATHQQRPREAQLARR